MVESEAGTEVEKLLSAAFSSVRELLRDGRLLSMGFFLFLFLGFYFSINLRWCSLCLYVFVDFFVDFLLTLVLLFFVFL